MNLARVEIVGLVYIALVESQVKFDALGWFLRPALIPLASSTVYRKLNPRVKKSSESANLDSGKNEVVQVRTN